MTPKERAEQTVYPFRNLVVPPFGNLMDLCAAVERSIGEAVADECGRANNFEMMCRRLVRRVPDGVLREQALDLLQRLGRKDGFLRDGDDA